MGKTAKTAMTYERTGTQAVRVRRKAIHKLNNDITKMPTHQILRRLYQRHSVGVWQIAVAITWFWVLFSKFN